MRSLVSCLLILGLVAVPQALLAAMSSTNFQIQWDTVSTGGGDTASSATYQLRDTVGNQAVGDSSGASYSVAAGYRQGVFDQILVFDVYAQSTSTVRAATAVVGTTVSASETGINTGDMVALVQNLGASQVVAVGQVVSTGVGSVEVDNWSDDGTFPTIDGTNDFLYVLTGASIDFENFSVSTVKTAVIAMQVSTDMSSGYTISVFDDGDLSNGSESIADVADGTVSAGSSEYGGRSSDSSLVSSTFDTQDTAFTTSTQEVVTVANPSFDDRTFVTLKAAINSGQASGTYSHTLSLVVSANY